MVEDSYKYWYNIDVQWHNIIFCIAFSWLEGLGVGLLTYGTNLTDDYRVST